MIEVEVHSSLRAFLREQGKPSWPHHLTMGRMVARALRLGRSALIQTGVETLQANSPQQSYRLSYLAPALILPDPVVVVAPTSVQKWLLQREIPSLQEWMGTRKTVHVGDRFPNENFNGLLITSPTSWLSDRFSDGWRFPKNVPTLIDGADDLEEWAREQLQACIEPWDWNELMLACPQQADLIRDFRVRLTKAIFQHPVNPYQCCLLDSTEQEILQQLFQVLRPEELSNQELYLPQPWQNFWNCWRQSGQLLWAAMTRSSGQFSLYCGPVEVATALNPIWSHQPIVLIGGILDLETSASVYRQQLGLGKLTCLKFSPECQSELIQLYLPDGLPMPNTPRFQEALVRQVRSLLTISSGRKKLAVLLVGDVPLKAQMGATLAAEFGSRVQVEKTSLDEGGVLVCGWEFWRHHQSELPPPHLLIIATLPIPSLENPLVAGQVAYYKQRNQDWFRLYLLPAALRELTRAIGPVRESQGVIALLDNRVNHRSYGRQVLSALSPFARINYLDASLFNSFIQQN